MNPLLLCKIPMRTEHLGQATTSSLGNFQPGTEGLLLKVAIRDTNAQVRHAGFDRNTKFIFTQANNQTLLIPFAL